jgi:exonuclease VII small subunit
MNSQQAAIDAATSNSNKTNSLEKRIRVLEESNLSLENRIIQLERKMELTQANTNILYGLIDRYENETPNKT